MLPTDPQQRKEMPIARGVLDYFPDAIADVAHVSFVGNEQHNPGQPLHWARDKSKDHADCIARHLMERGSVDEDGMRHSAKLAWRALALLQLEIEDGVPEANSQLTDPDFPHKVEDAGNGVRPANPMVAKATSGWVQQVFTDDSWRLSNQQLDIRQELLDQGCRSDVAQQIAAGTRFADPNNLGTRKFRNRAKRVYIAGPMRGYRVYIAGPMRGYPEYNFPAFDAARDRFIAAGWTVISPADIDRAAGLSEEDAKTDTTSPAAVREFIYRDSCVLQMLLRAECGDAVALLPGWEKSTGAFAEFGLGRWGAVRLLNAVTCRQLRSDDVNWMGLVGTLTDHLDTKRGV